MTPYEKIITRMRTEGAKDNPKGIRLGEMVSDDVVADGELKLDKDFYAKADGLKLKKGDTVAMTKINEELYLIICKVV